MQRNGADDLNGSYIEVSLDNQHLWLYKDGALVTETDIVSGAPKAGRETYRGAWPIAYKDVYKRQSIRFLEFHQL